MRTIELKGIKVHVDDEELAKNLAEPEPEPEVDEQEAEILLKEIEEWLTAGRSQVLNKAQRQLDELSKQFIGGDAAPQFPRGAGALGPRVSSQAAGAATGVIPSPNLPTWLVGTPQAQAAAQQIAISSIVEAVAAQLSTVLESFAAQMAEWVSTVAQKLFDTISDIADKMAAAHEKLGEQMAEVAERLEAVAEKLPEAEAETPAAEELLPLPPVEESTPSPEEEVAPPEEGAQEEIPPAEAGEVPPPEEEREAKSLAAPTPPQPQEPASSDVGVLFSPQFLAAFARHLSQMTKEIIDVQTRKSQPQPTAVKPQSAFEIAEQFAATLRKGLAGRKVETDLTAPVKTAVAPKEEGPAVADQVKGAAKDSEVRKHLEEAEKVAKEKAGEK